MDMVKRVIISILLVSVIGFTHAQKPGNNLGKTVYQLRESFPSLEYGWTENNEDIYYYKENDEFNERTFFFIFAGGFLNQESLIVKERGNLKYSAYLWFLTFSKKFYDMGSYNKAMVDSSILSAAYIFDTYQKIEFANSFTSEFYYSDFDIIINYNQVDKTCTMAYFKK